MERYKTGGTMKAFRIAVVGGLFFFGMAFAKRYGHERLVNAVTPQSPAQESEPQAPESSRRGVAEGKPQDFNARCHAAGVVVCQGFDSPLVNIAARWPAAGLYPGGDNMIHGKFDRE